MSEDLDPYDVLQVAADAGPEEVRLAFHRAVLLCHPDCCQGDIEAAKRRFAQVVGAYRRLREILIQQGRDDGEEIPISDQFDPADFARLTLGWEPRDPSTLSPGKLEWLPRVVDEQVKEPAVNETKVFAVCWLASIVLALGAGVAAAAITSTGGGAEESIAAVAILAMAGTYVGAFVLALLAIIGSRRTAWLRRIIGFRRQHALPAPKKGRRLPGEKEQ